MKYITELELRQNYKQEQFTDIVIPNETRLTPEAYQFLVDRHIRIDYQDSKMNNLHKTETDNFECKSITKEANILASEPMLGLQLEEVENQLFMLQHESSKAMNESLAKDLHILQESVVMLARALGGDESVLAPMQLASEGVVIGESTFSILDFRFDTIYAALIGDLNKIRLIIKQIAITLPERSAYYSECKTFIWCCILKIEQMITNVGGSVNEL